LHGQISKIKMPINTIVAGSALHWRILTCWARGV